MRWGNSWSVDSQNSHNTDPPKFCVLYGLRLWSPKAVTTVTSTRVLIGGPLVIQWLGLVLPMQGPWVLSRVRELTSCMLQVQPKKKKITDRHMNIIMEKSEIL